ncbi:hypothetical protein ALC60_04592 [Trachymyrmex zeteki]|uniref:Uncharacterized protein n=1 Tax=Mycetomoellerius zeteki TaxID=64791 RepID=A0A151X808_9HYME|nr:hypothetical protein ALC60_04592 [Trachymyrmex zeteki]
MSEPRKREEKIGPSLRRRRGYVERDEREEDGMARGRKGLKEKERERERRREEKSVGTVKEAGEKSRARERRRDNKRKGTRRARKGQTKTERVGKDEPKACGEGRQSGTEMEKGKERERERPTPCTCVTVRPRTRRRVLISQRAPRRRASFCEPCFFRRCTARRGAARSDEGEGARESRTVRGRRTREGGEGGGGGGGGIEELSSPEEIAVGIAGERSAKSEALSHYEDRRERKGWLVEGVHGISIARRNNWVQSGRLPYVTSAPFKRESASASSSHSHPPPRPSILPILEQDLPPSRQKNQLDAGKKRLEEEGEEGQEEEEAERDEEKQTEKGRGRHESGRKEEHAHTVETGAGDQGRCWYQSPLSVTEEEEGRSRGRRTSKNDLAMEEGRRDSEQEQRDGQHGTKATRELRKTTGRVQEERGVITVSVPSGADVL